MTFHFPATPSTDDVGLEGDERSLREARFDLSTVLLPHTVAPHAAPTCPKRGQGPGSIGCGLGRIPLFAFDVLHHFPFPQFRRRRGLLSFFSSSNVEQEAAAALVPNLAVPPSCQIQTRIHHTAPDSRRDSAGAPIRLEINERMHPVRG